MRIKKQNLTLPLLVTRGLIIYPFNQKVIEAGRSFSVNAIKAGKDESDNFLFLTTQRNQNLENPTSTDLYEVGVFCRIISFTERDRSVKVRVEVLDRVEFSQITFDDENGYYVATGALLENPAVENEEKANAYIEAIRNQIDSMPAIMNNMPKSVLNTLSKGNNLLEVIYTLASFVDAQATKNKLY